MSPNGRFRVYIVKKNHIKFDFKVLVFLDSPNIQVSPSSFTFRSVVAEPSSALDSSSGVVKMWVRIPAWPVAALVSLSKTL